MGELGAEVERTANARIWAVNPVNFHDNQESTLNIRGKYF
jgi:hypothetical protein